MGKLVLYPRRRHDPVDVPLDEGARHDRPPRRQRRLPAVSRRCRGEHAAVVTILADSFLEDLGSTNGTLVNGKADRQALPARPRPDRHRPPVARLPRRRRGVSAEPPPSLDKREDRRDLAPPHRAGEARTGASSPRWSPRSTRNSARRSGDARGTRVAQRALARSRRPRHARPSDLRRRASRPKPRRRTRRSTRTLRGDTPGTRRAATRRAAPRTMRRRRARRSDRAWPIARADRPVGRTCSRHRARRVRPRPRRTAGRRDRMARRRALPRAAAKGRAPPTINGDAGAPRGSRARSRRRASKSPEHGSSSSLESDAERHLTRRGTSLASEIAVRRARLMLASWLAAPAPSVA